MIACMPTNKELQPIATKLFIRKKEQDVYFVFISQSYFTEPEI